MKQSIVPAVLLSICVLLSIGATQPPERSPGRYTIHPAKYLAVSSDPKQNQAHELQSTILLDTETGSSWWLVGYDASARWMPVLFSSNRTHQTTEKP